MIKELLLQHFRLNTQTVKLNSKGLGHEESLLAPQPAGNCLNWTVGHIIATRQDILRLLEKTPIWQDGEERPYVRGSAPLLDASRALPYEKLMNDLDASMNLIEAAIREIDEQRLTAQPSISDSSSKKDPLAKTLSFFAFHESYHVGQTGILRRLAGKTGAIR